MRNLKFTVLALTILGSLVAFADKPLNSAGNPEWADKYLKSFPASTNSQNGYYAILAHFKNEDDTDSFIERALASTQDPFIALAKFGPDKVSSDWRVMIAANTSLDLAKEACSFAKDRNLSADPKNISSLPPHLWVSPKLKAGKLPPC